MKKRISLMMLFLLSCSLLFAQQPDYNVVFDMSTRDSVSQQAVIREVELITKESPAAMLEVVIYGQALNLALRSGSKHAAAITELTNNKNVSFKVCAFTMKRENVTDADLLPGIKVVPDGIYEIISKQHMGWGYIKVSH
jgi:uncharacterized protein